MGGGECGALKKGLGDLGEALAGGYCLILAGRPGLVDTEFPANFFPPLTV